MKRIAFVLAALLIAAAAHAQTDVQSGQSTNGNNLTRMVGGRVAGSQTMTDLKFMPDSSLIVYLANSEANTVPVSSNVISTTFSLGSGGRSVDSSLTAVSVAGYKNLALVINPTFKNDSLGSTLFALQPRFHFAAAVDSSNTFGALRNLTGVGSTPATAAANAAYDTIGTINVTDAPYATTAVQKDEAALGWAHVSGNPNYAGRAKWVMLTGPKGILNGGAPYLSVRLRMVAQYIRASGAAANQTTQGQPVAVSVRLVAWN